MWLNRQQVHSKYDWHCGYCWTQIDIKEMQIDHIIPKRNFRFHIINKFHIPNFLFHLWENDMNHIDNLMPSCRVCNNWKSTFTLDQFREEISYQIDRLRKQSSNFRLAEKYWLICETKKAVKFYFES